MVNQVGDNSPDGMNWGLSSSEKIAFYGATPVIRRSGSVQSALGSAAAIGATSASAFGYATSAQADGIVDQLNEVRNTLVALGLWAGS